MTLVERLKRLRDIAARKIHTFPLYGDQSYDMEAAELRDTLDEAIPFVEAATATLSPVPGNICSSDQTKN